MDHAALSRELIRCLRGERSQPWLCRRLGLRSNLVYRWEAGRAYPSAPQFFRTCRVTHARGPLELGQSLFGEVTARQLETEAGVTQLLQHLARSTSIQELAKKLS